MVEWERTIIRERLFSEESKVGMTTLFVGVLRVKIEGSYNKKKIQKRFKFSQTKPVYKFQRFNYKN